MPMLRRNLRFWTSLPFLALGAMVLLDASLPVGLLSGPAHRGYSLHTDGRYGDAVESYQDALGRQPRDPVLLFNLGTALLEQGRLQEAEASFRRVGTEVDPELRSALFHNLALVQLLEALRVDVSDGSEGADPGSLAAASWSNGKRALRLSPDRPDTRWNLELALRVEEGNPARALDPRGASHRPGDPTFPSPDVALPLEMGGLLQALRSEETTALYRLLAQTLAGGGRTSTDHYSKKGPPW